MDYSLYNKEQLAYERSIGLELTDEQNENFYAPASGQTCHWTKAQYEKYLATREWSDETKNKHRNLFKGTITFDNGAISY